MGDQYSEVAVKLGQYIAPALDREITDEDYQLFDLLLDFAKDKIFAQGDAGEEEHHADILHDRILFVFPDALRI